MILAMTEEKNDSTTAIPAEETPTGPLKAEEGKLPELKAIAAIFRLSSTAYNAFSRDQITTGSLQRYLRLLKSAVKSEVSVLAGQNNEVSVTFLILAKQASDVMRYLQGEFHHFLIGGEMRLAISDVQISENPNHPSA